MALSVDTSSSFPAQHRLEQGAEIAAELNPESGHIAEPFLARRGQPVVLPGVTGSGVDPLRVNQSVRFEAVQDHVKSPFRQSQTGTALERSEDFEAVEPALPQTGENRHLQTSLAELRLPVIRVIICWLGHRYSWLGTYQAY